MRNTRYTSKSCLQQNKQECFIFTPETGEILLYHKFLCFGGWNNPSTVGKCLENTGPEKLFLPNGQGYIYAVLPVLD